MSGQDGRWEQFNNTCSLISVPQWHHTPRSVPSWIYMVRQMLPVKADLVIFSPVTGLPRYIVLECGIHVML